MSSEIDYRRIGRHFRAARQQLNLKQKDVAELLGVSVKTYSNMECGAQELSLYRIIQLCQLLKLKPGCVLDDCNDDLLTLETLPETVCEAKAQLMLLSSKCSDETAQLLNSIGQLIATVYKGNIIKNLIMDCQSYTKYRPNETTGGIFVSWRRKEELPTGA